MRDRDRITIRDLAAFATGANVACLAINVMWWMSGYTSELFGPVCVTAITGFIYICARAGETHASLDAVVLLSDRLRSRAVDAQALLMANRPADAADVLEALGDDVDGIFDDIYEAYEAAAAENVPDAICHIERFLSPSAARGMT